MKKLLKKINLIYVYMFIFLMGGIYIFIYGQELPADVGLCSFIFGPLIFITLVIFEFDRQYENSHK